eukprot:jgi/Psemu1/43112/gm1.43112_g
MSNMEEIEEKGKGQIISLLSEEIVQTDEEDDRGVETQKDAPNEKRKRVWGKLIFWRNGRSLETEDVESEALVPTDFDDEGEVGGGDISTSDLVYERTADNKENISIDLLDDDANGKEDNGENGEVVKEGDLLFLTQSPKKNHSESLPASSSPTLVTESTKSESDIHDDESESSSDDSSDDDSESSVGDISTDSSESSSEDSSDDDSDCSSADEDSEHNLLKNLSDGRRALNRRYASTRSHLTNRENGSISSQTPLSRSVSLISGFSDNEKRYQDIDPDGRKRIHGRIEGFGSSVSPEKESSPKTFRGRLSIFRKRKDGMKKMDTGIQKNSWADSIENTMNNIADAMIPQELQPFEEGYMIAPVIKDTERTIELGEMKKMHTGMQKTSWADRIENTMNNIADAVLPPEPYEEGYMIARVDDIERKPVRKNVNQGNTTSVSSKSNAENKNYFLRMEQDLRRKDLEIMCWKNRVKDLEEEVKRLREMIDENSLTNKRCDGDNTGIEWQSGDDDLINQMGSQLSLSIVGTNAS